MEIMAPLYHATFAMPEEQIPTVGIISPLLQKLKNHFEANGTDDEFQRSIKAAVFDNLSARYTNEATVNFLPEASALDPRFKHVANDAAWDRIKEKLATKPTKDIAYDNSLPSQPDSPVELEVTQPAKKRALSFVLTTQKLAIDWETRCH